eukprot:4323827-Pyramimonas_sp.AAC.1
MPRTSEVCTLARLWRPRGVQLRQGFGARHRVAAKGRRSPRWGAAEISQWRSSPASPRHERN